MSPEDDGAGAKNYNFIPSRKLISSQSAGNKEPFINECRPILLP